MNTAEAKKCDLCGKTYDSSLADCPEDGQLLVPVEALLGELLDSPYRIESVIGKGGMRVVNKAMYVHLDAKVAGKVLASELVANQDAIERFRPEAKAAGYIHHPNAIQVTDSGVTAEGVVYLVMKLSRWKKVLSQKSANFQGNQLISCERTFFHLLS